MKTLKEIEKLLEKAQDNKYYAIDAQDEAYYSGQVYSLLKIIEIIKKKGR